MNLEKYKNSINWRILILMKFVIPRGVSDYIKVGKTFKLTSLD